MTSFNVNGSRAIKCATTMPSQYTLQKFSRPTSNCTRHVWSMPEPVAYFGTVVLQHLSHLFPSLFVNGSCPLCICSAPSLLKVRSPQLPVHALRGPPQHSHRPPEHQLSLYNLPCDSMSPSRYSPSHTYSTGVRFLCASASSHSVGTMVKPTRCTRVSPYT